MEPVQWEQAEEQAVAEGAAQVSNSAPVRADFVYAHSAAAGYLMPWGSHVPK